MFAVTGMRAIPGDQSTGGKFFTAAKAIFFDANVAAHVCLFLPESDNMRQWATTCDIISPFDDGQQKVFSRGNK